MTRWLQDFGFRSSPYERPSQKWICGRAAEGNPCRLGPDAGGRCAAAFECLPMKKGGGWYCSRPDFAGGKCADGPLPAGTCSRPVERCTPVRSPRSRRGRAAQWLSALTLGAILVLVGGSLGPEIISPGQLSSGHAELKDCGSCHTAFKGGAAGWLRAAFVDNAEVADSRLCLDCHRLGNAALLAHNRSRGDLKATTERARPASLAGTESAVVSLASHLFDGRQTRNETLSCRLCHKEHRGRNADISAMTNVRCQACHGAKFASLARGHPDFDRYAQTGRTRLAFDHVSHVGKHFKDKKVKAQAPKDCKSCHMPDAAGRTMLVGGFEAVCGACHADQIEGAGRAGTMGIPFLTIPGLDLEVLRVRGAAIGEWPEYADGELTPFMDFLLSGDADFAAAKSALRGVDLMDLVAADDGQIAAVEKLAWSVKGLLFDLLREGAPGIKTRLERSLGRPLSNPELARLTAVLPVDTIRMTQRQWCPNLVSEMVRYRAGETVPMPGFTDAGDGGDGAKAGRGESAGPRSAGDDILPKESDGVLDRDNGGLLLTEDDLGGGDAGQSKTTDAEPEEPGTPAFLPDERWAAGGGWYRDEYFLVYRPTGHADGFVRTWLDIAGGTAGPLREDAARRVFAALSAPRAPGVCVKCHTVDPAGPDTFTVNWLGARPEPGRRKVTTFSHASHFSLTGEKGCLSCHALDGKAGTTAGSEEMESEPVVSNVLAVERKACTACHTEERAGDSCLTCHNYHIGTFPPTIGRAPMMVHDFAKPVAR
ncbi:MAG: hypothetical protein V3R55_06655 [Alphaproteobacteria bacterium]